ncbi:MAG: hypothetical protein PVSMB1_03010 [Gemmatimonadaceae bacterium]
MVFAILMGRATPATTQVLPPESAQTPPTDPTDGAQPSDIANPNRPNDGEAGTPYLTLGNRKVFFGVDFSFAGVHDESLRAAMGRERQIKVAFVNLAVYGEVNPSLSYAVVANPANDGIVPKPYEPQASDRRTFFFPNRPEGRGAVSDPGGLYKVDDYKHPGLDPILQQGALRIAYLDAHTADKRFGVAIGRNYVPQGLMLSELAWFTAKDLTHIQRINAQADNGATGYLNFPRMRVDLALITGNGNPYHDYAYFDFTDPTEGKNSSIGGVVTGRVRSRRAELGATIRHNFLNSRIEDSTTLQLSKHTDDAAILFGKVEPTQHLRIFGEYARYRWGMTPSSAALLKGPRVKTPIIKNGGYLGAEVYTSTTRFGKWGAIITREELKRDDALVAWAAANRLFGVRLGKKERSTIVKIYAEFGPVTAFFSLNALSNPFPELSAIKAIRGPGAEVKIGNMKRACGVRFKI